MEVFVGAVQERGDGWFGGVGAQDAGDLRDAVVDAAGLHAVGAVEHLSGDVDAAVEVAAGGEDEGEAGVAVYLASQVGHACGTH